MVNKTDGTLYGYLPDIMNHIAGALNITVQYIPFRIPARYSHRYENGTWVGAIADVANGLHETSVAGFSYTLERQLIGYTFLDPFYDNNIKIVFQLISPAQLAHQRWEFS